MSLTSDLLEILLVMVSTSRGRVSMSSLSQADCLIRCPDADPITGLEDAPTSLHVGSGWREGSPVEPG